MITFQRKGKTSPNSLFGCEPSPAGSSKCTVVLKKQELQQGRPGGKLNIPQEQFVGYKGSPVPHRQHGLLQRGSQTPAPPAPRMDVRSWLGIGQASVLVQRAVGS